MPAILAVGLLLDLAGLVGPAFTGAGTLDHRWGAVVAGLALGGVVVTGAALALGGAVVTGVELALGADAAPNDTGCTGRL